MLKKQKQVLVSQMRDKRKQISEDDCLIASQKIATQITQLEKYLVRHKNKDAIIAIYAAKGKELNIFPLGQGLEKLGYTLALPDVISEKEMIFREFHCDEKASLEVGFFGVVKPNSANKPVVPEVILLPLLACDKRGGRLGYGAGYYDRAIGQIKQANITPLLIAIAFEWQLLDNVPQEEHDQKMDAILTPERFIIINEINS